MRQKTFIVAPLEDIVAIVYSPGKRIAVQVGMGNEVEGKFVELPEQNFETYELDISNGLELFEINPDVMGMIDQFKTYCWQSIIDPIRTNVEMERAKQEAFKQAEQEEKV
jgi:hypothetical protein